MLFTFEIDEETLDLIKKHYNFKTDEEVNKQIQYWLNLSIYEVVIKDTIELLETK